MSVNDSEHGNLFQLRGVSTRGLAWNLSNKAETCALIQSSCSKTTDWNETDFSEADRWYLDKVRGYRN